MNAHAALACASLLLSAAQALAAPQPWLSDDALQLRLHVLAVGDNAARPFGVLDKKRAHLWLFDARGRVLGDTPVLIGWARGDDSASDIGTRPIEQVRPHERTTPAGRYLTERGRNLRREPVLWVDYDAALSMHRVVTHTPSERRLERLASASARDNRISYGCINLPHAFFDATLQPLATRAAPVLYILPETRPWQTLFVAPAGTTPAVRALPWSDS